MAFEKINSGQDSKLYQNGTKFQLSFKKSNEH